MAKQDVCSRHMYMKKIVVTILGFILAPLLARSADAPAAPAKPPIATQASFNWTGGYVGLNGGYASNISSSEFALIPDALLAHFLPPSALTTLGFPATTRLNSRGPAGGVQAGYNYQIGRIVFGPEADISSLHQSASSTVTVVDNSGIPSTSTRSESLDWLGTSRLRLGFTPIDRLLVYGTGGVAFGHMSGATNTVSPGINILFHSCPKQVLAL